MPTDPRDLLPLKPLVFQVLLALSREERHGWSLVREAQEHLGERILPANFYRTLRTMLSDGLIVETGKRKADHDDDERRKYFRLTTLGQEAARLEARRLHNLVSDSRTRRLLSTK
jgi:DNA-binding PadR family transcriptional regulator